MYTAVCDAHDAITVRLWRSANLILLDELDIALEHTCQIARIMKMSTASAVEAQQQDWTTIFLGRFKVWIGLFKK